MSSEMQPDTLCLPRRRQLAASHQGIACNCVGLLISGLKLSLLFAEQMSEYRQPSTRTPRATLLAMRIQCFSIIQRLGAGPTVNRSSISRPSPQALGTAAAEPSRCHHSSRHAAGALSQRSATMLNVSAGKAFRRMLPQLVGRPGRSQGAGLRPLLMERAAGGRSLLEWSGAG